MRVILLNGTVGSGKTTTLAALGHLLQEAGIAHALVDLDRLRDAWPAPADDPFNTRLELANLAAVARTYRDAGAEVLALAGVIEHRTARAGYDLAVASPVEVVRLRLDARLLRERLLGRHRDDDPDRDWHLDRAGELHRILDTAGVDDHVIDVGRDGPRQVAERVRDAVGLLTGTVAADGPDRRGSGPVRPRDEPAMATDPPSLPPWPRSAPAHGAVVLREMREGDVAMVRELATDPYVPTVGSLPRDADDVEALAWIGRQRGRHADGTGFCFTITESGTGQPVGNCGLWLDELPAGRGSAGYAVVPSARGRGLAADAVVALTTFGWTLPGLFRIALYIEPWNIASIRTAERAGYRREGLLRSHHLIAGEHRDMLLYAAVRDGRGPLPPVEPT